MGTKDYINELIENIEKDYPNYVICIIKDDKESPAKNIIDLYTKMNEDSLTKLIDTLVQYKKKNKTNGK